MSLRLDVPDSVWDGEVDEQVNLTADRSERPRDVGWALNPPA